jgi:hypothetical protein
MSPNGCKVEVKRSVRNVSLTVIVLCSIGRSKDGTGAFQNGDHTSKAA